MTPALTHPLHGGPASPGYDEAFASGGTPREHYAAVIDAVLATGPRALASAMTAAARAAVLSLGAGSEVRLLPVDPVPRVFTAGEWSGLEAGLIQRGRMLEALVGGIYESPRLLDGVLPEDIVSTSVYLERDLVTTAPAGPALGIVGFDVVRRPDGALAVLEDNLLTPGHVALPALRDLNPLRAAAGVADVAVATTEQLGAMIGGGDEAAAILSDQSGERASWELRELGSMLGIPVLGYEDLQVRGARLCTRSGQRIDVLWQRTSEDRLRDDSGGLTALGRLLLEPLRAGAVRMVSAIGCGVADDKRMFRHTPALTRVLLGEEPLLPIVETLDLTLTEDLALALETLDTLVFKPRNGAGARGLWMPPHDTRALRDAISADPGALVAQERLALSRHPTVAGDRLEGRIVDLRVFAVRTPGGWKVIPGGVSRYPMAADGEVVNTSRGGGVKDVWVLTAPGGVVPAPGTIHTSLPPPPREQLTTMSPAAGEKRQKATGSSSKPSGEAST